MKRTPGLARSNSTKTERSAASDKALRGRLTSVSFVGTASVEAREELEKEALRESRWTVILKRLEYLPRAIIVEPFGPLEMGGSRTIELAVAKRDKESLERAVTLIQELARTIGPTSLVDELERIDGNSRA